jgi:hypothetical protein
VKIAQKNYGQENIKKQRGQEGRRRKKKTENKVGKKEGGGGIRNSVKDCTETAKRSFGSAYVEMRYLGTAKAVRDKDGES